MAVLSKTQYKTLYGSSGSVFPDNTTEEISEEDMRQFGEDTADSFNSVLESNSVQSWKSPCAVATTANITLSGEQTIDGVLTSGSRVLVKNQTTTSQNGIYVSDAGAWSRSTDADAAAELEGAAVGVTQGTTQQNTVWLQTSDSINLGTTAIQWQQIGFGGGTQTLASVLTTGNDAGGLAIENLDDPTNAQDAATKAYVDAEVAGAGGITNGASANELMKSDGTNAVASGIFSSAAGDLQLGSSSIANDRNITVAGSSSNVTLNLSSKGTGQIRFIFTSNACLLVQNPSGTAVTLQQLNPGVFTVVGYDGITGNSGGDVLLRSGNGHTNGNGGTLYLSPGAKAGSGADGNIGLLASSGSFGSGQKVIFIANATTVPSSNPTGGGILYVESGALKYRGSSGTVTTIANA